MKDHLAVPGEAKVIRAIPHAAQAEAGNIFLVEAPWNMEWLDEHASFPESTFSDQVDATSGAFNKLARQINLDPGPIHRTQRVGADDHSRFGVHLIRSRAERFGMQEAGT